MTMKVEKRVKEFRFYELRAVPISPMSNDTPPDTDPKADPNPVPEMIVEGYASVFDQPAILFSIDKVDYKETVANTAFVGADMKDVAFRYNHNDSNMIMARTRNKTLQLTVDDKGLAIRASLAPTSQGKDLYALIQRGDVDKMSLAFIVADDDYDSDTHTRTINKFERVIDVSAVDFPAFDQTSISATEQSGKRKFGVGPNEYFEAWHKQEVFDEQRKALPFVKTDISTGPWDGPKATTNLKTGPDIKADYYRQAFAWVDPDANPDTKGAYKFIHHDVSDDGDIGAANVKGCQSGIGVLNGGMGGSKIPDEDKQGVWDHLAGHIKDAKLTPPELKSKQEIKQIEKRRKKLLLETYC